MPPTRAGSSHHPFGLEDGTSWVPPKVACCYSIRTAYEGASPVRRNALSADSSLEALESVPPEGRCGLPYSVLIVSTGLVRPACRAGNQLRSATLNAGCLGSPPPPPQSLQLAQVPDSGHTNRRPAATLPPHTMQPP